jgi:hypothetical protein
VAEEPAGREDRESGAEPVSEGTKSVGRYGFRLTGYKGNVELYSERVFVQDEWVDTLRKVCVSHNLTYRYNIERLLGKGNFAKVGLVASSRAG